MKITRRQLRRIIKEAMPAGGGPDVVGTVTGVYGEKNRKSQALVSKRPLNPEEKAVIDRPIPEDMHPDLVEEIQEYQKDYIKMYNDMFDLHLDKGSLYKPKDKYAWEKKHFNQMTAWEKIQFYKQDMPYALETLQGLWGEYDNNSQGTRK